MCSWFSNAVLNTVMQSHLHSIKKCDYKFINADQSYSDTITLPPDGGKKKSILMCIAYTRTS